MKAKKKVSNEKQKRYGLWEKGKKCFWYKDFKSAKTVNHMGMVWKVNTKAKSKGVVTDG